MRRFTFSVMLALATVAVNAQTEGPTWTDNLTTTEAASDLHRGGAMAIDNEGNSIVTGSFTTDLEFADSYLEHVATSAFIAKYDKAGNKKWAAGLSGAATITAVTTDAEGNIYAAGVFADVVNILDANGETKETINGMADQTDQVSGFVAKYDKNGSYVASKIIIPEVDAEISNKIATADFAYAVLSPTFTPKKLLTDGKHLYMSVSYKDNATIDNVTLVGSYVNLSDMIFQDATAMGILSFNASDLTDTKIISTCKASEKETEVIYNTEDVNFAINGEDVYVAYVASGKSMTLDFEGKTTVIPLEYSAAAQEHAFILGSKNTTKIYNSIAIESNSLNFIDEMEYKKGNLYLAGTFNKTLPFDNNKESVGGCDTYLTSLKASDFSQNWSVTSGFDEGDAMHNAEVVTGMAIYDDHVTIAGWAEATSGHIVATPLNFEIDTEETPSEMETYSGTDAIFATSVAQNDLYTLTQSDNKQVTGATEGTYTYSFYNDEDDNTNGIQQIAATADNTINFDGSTVALTKAADITLYTVSGAIVKSVKNATSLSLDNVASGIYLLKAGKQTIKIVK